LLFQEILEGFTEASGIKPNDNLDRCLTLVDYQFPEIWRQLVESAGLRTGLFANDDSKNKEKGDQENRSYAKRMEYFLPLRFPRDADACLELSHTRGHFSH
jgi:hypothetical protein